MFRKAVALMCAALLCFAIVGCGNNANSGMKEKNGTGGTVSLHKQNAINPPINTEPITLKVYQHAANITDLEFKQYFVDPVKKKYPNITLTLVRNSQADDLASLVASGQLPDIIFTANTNMNQYHELNVPTDLSELIKMNKVDASQFDPVVMKAIQTEFGPTGIWGLPFSNNYFVTFYNKEIFDKFGVTYPKDKMTWDQMLEVAKRVTREESGTQYFGMLPGTINTFGTGLGLPFVDPKTSKPLVDTDGRKTMFEVGSAFYEIPGMDPKIYLGKDAHDAFMINKTMAMFPYFGTGVVNEMEQFFKQNKTPFQWDMVSFPSFKENPGKSMVVNFHLMLLATTSKHKEEAFHVMQLMTSKEIQLDESANGRVSILKGVEYQKNFGSAMESLKGKNINAIFATEATLNPSPTEYDNLVAGPIDNAFKQVISRQKDINTALREAQQIAEKNVEAKKSQ